jgi:tellurite resistance protein
MAPPAIGFISYTKLAGELNDFSRILYYFSLFMFLVLTVQLPYFYKLKFQLSFWAYTFPLSAIIVANYLFFTFTKIIFIKYLTLSLLIILSVLVLILLYQTFKNILNQKICVAE